MIAILNFLVISVLLGAVAAGTKAKPHAHQGMLKQFDGKHIPYRINLDQDDKLSAGNPVLFTF